MFFAKTKREKVKNDKLIDNQFQQFESVYADVGFRVKVEESSVFVGLAVLFDDLCRIAMEQVMPHNPAGNMKYLHKCGWIPLRKKVGMISSQIASVYDRALGSCASTNAVLLSMIVTHSNQHM